MDHFPIPAGKGHIRVPNKTTEDYVRGEGGFDGYPARKRWAEDDVMGKNSFGKRPPEVIQAFFQNWLYFGCIIEVLAITGIEAKKSDFLDSEQQMVTTRKLPSFLRKWRQIVKQEKEEAHIIDWAMRTDLILRKVSNFVNFYCLPYASGGERISEDIRKERNATSPLSEKIWMSIIALGHTLMEGMLFYYDIRRTANNWGASTMLKRRMLKNGWCPMDVQRSLTDMGIDGHYYIAKLSNPQGLDLHKRCSDYQCIAQDIDEKQYKIQHVREDNDCDGLIELDITRLIKIIESENTPVVTWNPSTKMLKVVPSKTQKRGVSTPPYVAISHVWSDGMGNPDRNAMLQCRLDSLQEMIASASVSAKLKDNPQHFWVDTLCVPVGKSKRQKELRKLCIRRMAGIYEGATSVLVLSSNVQHIPSTADEFRVGLALYFANWNHRLWTFQEGMLAKKLLFQFSDKALNFQTEMNFPGSARSIMRGHCVTWASKGTAKTMGELLLLRDFLRHQLFSPEKANSEPLPIMVNAISFRTTSRISDETLCVGTLMRFDLHPLLEAPGEDDKLAECRMEIFLKMVEEFPPDIIFNTHLRMQKDGFHWAPKSLLGIPSGGFTRSVEGSPAVHTDLGLSLISPGFLITRPRNQGGALSFFATIPQHDARLDHLEVKVDLIQHNDEPKRFAWTAGARYALIMRTRFENPRRAMKWDKQTPQTKPDLELWFEERGERASLMSLSFDAVVGRVLDIIDDDSGELAYIQVRHECLAKITVLNPSALQAKKNRRKDHSQDDDEPLTADLIHAVVNRRRSDTINSSELPSPDADSNSDWESEEDNPEELSSELNEFDLSSADSTSNSGDSSDEYYGSEGSSSEDDNVKVTSELEDDDASISTTVLGSEPDYAYDSGSDSYEDEIVHEKVVKTSETKDVETNVRISGELVADHSLWFIM